MNNRNMFEINEVEKNRILMMHENATKKLYLSEDEVSAEVDGNSYSSAEVDEGNRIAGRLLQSRNMEQVWWVPICGEDRKDGVANPFRCWAKLSMNGFPSNIVEAFGEYWSTYVLRSSVVDEKVSGKIGRFFLKNPSKEDSVDNIINMSVEDMKRMVRQFAQKPIN